MSAVAIIKPDAKEIIVSAKLWLYGDFATQELANKIIDEINTQYNQAQGKINIQEANGSTAAYLIKFEIDAAVFTLDKAFDLVHNNTDYRNNFIRIEQQNIVQRSFMGAQLGSNIGHWLISDNLGESTTAAHEFGHSLGLDHPDDCDLRDRELPPPMMAPRGTLVKQRFQWNPTVNAGEFGGTLKPIYRKVCAEEVQTIFTGKVFSADGTLNLGILTNLVYDEIGNPYYFIE
ncbi:zinc metalloprotease [Emticicia soli]|uniref:Peptidase M10 n=1 Tax=Emticicia soli TaxID=2027878 RepID=A0ABW5J1G6_9BACT